MPEITPESLNHAISVVANGLGIDEIVARFGEEASRRTLQRRLDEMVRAGQLERVGKARATKYRVVRQPEKVVHTPAVPLSESNILREDIPAAASDPLRDLKDYFRDHHSQRKPAWYNREFLDAYVPNETMYLPEKLRAHLLSKGQSPEMAALPPGTHARMVMDRLIIDLTWNSSRLEGSTFSLLETDFLLQQGDSGDPVRTMESRMILNHKRAIEFLLEAQKEMGFNRYTFLNLHSTLTEHLMKDHKTEGALRTIPVGIGGSVYHPTNNPALIEECFDLILQKAGAIRDPLECSFFLMVHMPYLQPFTDGNKRTSRLAANIPLIQANVAPLSFTGVPVRDYTTGILGVYELNRIELLREVFVHAYEESAGRYALIRDEVGLPDPAAFRYQVEIADFVRGVVVRRLTKMQAASELRHWAAANITADDRASFIEIVESKLLALTMGSIVRVRVRPSEFDAWWPEWSGQQGK
jgi:fido (protein-threonine AMPylation protein)